jgi:hypothetical protein
MHKSLWALVVVGVLAFLGGRLWLPRGSTLWSRQTASSSSTTHRSWTFVVVNGSYCSAGEMLGLRSVPTSDNPECLVNYCRKRPSTTN